MPIAGFVRRRRHQFGRQATLGTPVPATRVYPFKGVPSVDPQWTDPDIDQGSVDPVIAPYRGPGEYTAPLTDPILRYNDLPLLLAAIFGGGVTPTGTGAAKTWAFAPSSVEVDDFDFFTYEFGDDVTTDWLQARDGILEQLELMGPEGLGPVTASMTWRFGGVASTGSTDSPVVGVPTDIDLVANEAIVYLKDAGLYISSDTAGLASDQISDALHSVTLRVSLEVDKKRMANATQSYDVTGYGLSVRKIEVEAVFAKTADTVGTGSESDAWLSDVAVDRYLRLAFESVEVADVDTPYSFDLSLPIRYYTRTDGESGGNSTVTLTGHAFYDPTDFEGVFSATVVNTLGSL